LETKTGFSTAVERLAKLFANLSGVGLSNRLCPLAGCVVKSSEERENEDEGEKV
jgi:hypothetical protein